MNRNKIISTILISSLLADMVPIVNASVVEMESVIENEFVEIESTEDSIIQDSKDNENIEEDNSSNVNSSDKEDDFIENLIPDTSLEDENKDEEDVSNESADEDNEEITDDVDFDTNEDNSENEILNEEVSEDNMEDSAVISPAENNSSDELSKSIVVNNDVIEVTLGENQYVPNLTGDIGKYTTIKVITTGGKKLVTQDYDNLRNSKIPNVDLSNAKSDSIPGGAFYNATHLKTFKFPKDITAIGGEEDTYLNGAFRGCTGFTGELIIPDSVTLIGNSAFSGCTGLTGNLVIPDSVTSIGNSAFSFCEGFTGDLIIGNSVTSIGDFAFSTCNGFAGNLIIGDSVTSIGRQAFAGCIRLTGKLVLPDSITSIGPFAFNSCRGFTGDLIIPDSLVSIEDKPFLHCTNINKFIFSVDERFEDSEYRKNIFDNLVGNNIVVEMPYDLDTFGTWLDDLSEEQNGKPRIKSESTTVNGDKNTSVSLYIPTPYKEDNITILKDGENFNLPEKNVNREHIFNEEGIYNITIKTDLGTVSNIDFEVAALISKPTINYENNSISIVDNGNNLGLAADRIEYRLNNGEWREYSGCFRIPDELVNGVDEIKVEARIIVKDKISKTTEYSLIVPKAQLNVENTEFTQGDNFDENNIATAIDIDGSDISDRVTVVSSDVKADIPGEYTILYRVEASNGYFTEKEITVKVIPLVINEPTIKYENNIVTITDNGNNSINSLNEIEYRINSGEWIKYLSEFRIPDSFVNGIDSIKIEARAVVEDKSSDIDEISVRVLKSEINAKDIEITEGDSFNELDYVTATDIDGSDISDRVAVVSNNVKINKPGTYKVVYRVQASNGYFTEKEVKVTVLKKKLPNVSLKDNIVIDKNDTANILESIINIDSIGDKSKLEVVNGSVNLLKPGEYILTLALTDENNIVVKEDVTVEITAVIRSSTDINKYGVSYRVTSENGNVEEATISVTIKDSSSNNNNNNDNNDNLPNTGGYDSLTYLMSIMSLIGGIFTIKKKRK